MLNTIVSKQCSSNGAVLSGTQAISMAQARPAKLVHRGDARCIRTKYRAACADQSDGIDDTIVQ
jgi:hypothetical protein